MKARREYFDQNIDQKTHEERRARTSGSFDGMLFDLQNLAQDYTQLMRLEARKYSSGMIKIAAAGVFALMLGGAGIVDLLRSLSGFAVQAEVLSNFRALLLAGFLELLMSGMLLWYIKRSLGKLKHEAQKIKADVTTSAASSSAQMGRAFGEAGTVPAGQPQSGLNDTGASVDPKGRLRSL